MSDLEGRLSAALGAAYVLERELGGGGMSRVFLARETALKRPVVIKVLPPELDGVVSAERFRREISLAARLQHPIIVPLLTAGEADALLYYTMPFIEGTSLRAELDRAGALPVDRATHIVRDVLEALSYAHAHGVIHRDIKPENVLLASHHAVVSDFGVAKALDAAGTGAGKGPTTAGLIIGSPAYMAPEQAAADPTVDHRADLYSVGVMMYEMLTGSGPYGKRTPSQYLAAHIAEQPAPVSAKRKEVPEALAELVMRLLEKDPAARPQTADEALAVLDGATLARRPARPPRRAVRVAAGIVALALVGVGLARWRPWERRAISVAAPSIAVMRFADRSPGHADAYLSDGMSEELIGALSRVRGLRVMGRASSFRLNTDSLSEKEIGEKLGVNAVLEGSVERDGKKLQVAATLVDAPSSRVLWHETYERDMSNVLAMQAELTKAIVSNLSAQLVSPDSAGTHPRAVNPEAYQLYLQGRYFWYKRSPESLMHSLELFQRAIAIDSGYARAYAGLADAYNVIGGLYIVPPLEALPKAKAAAMHAIALDSGLAEAHAALGFSRMYLDWDWEGARKEHERAVALDSNYATGHLYYSFYLASMGKMDSAMAEMRRALALDPFSLIVNLRYADLLVDARRFDDAIAQYRYTIALDSGFAVTGTEIPRTLAVKGDYRAAIAEYAKYDQPGEPYTGGDRLWALAKAGMRDSALALLARWPKGPRKVASPALANALRALGRTDSAYAEFTRVVDQRGSFVIQLASDPFYEEIRRDPRYAAQYRRMGITPSAR